MRHPRGADRGSSSSHLPPPGSSSHLLAPHTPACPISPGSQVLAEVYQVVVDKGTFDAISLGETALQDKKRWVQDLVQVQV